MISGIPVISAIVKFSSTTVEDNFNFNWNRILILIVEFKGSHKQMI